MNRLFIVKLGGSFIGAGAARQWIDVLASCAGDASAARTALVPGGGPFADAVRAAQSALGFDDRTAHRMALAAMTQFGVALCALEPRLALAASRGAFGAAWRSGRVPVWRPELMALADPTIPQSWDVTSDSLALWLAWRLDAHGVVLIKQARPSPAGWDAMTHAGLVDLAFGACLARWPVPAWIAGPGDAPALGAALRTGHMDALVPIVPDPQPAGSQKP